MLGVWDHRLTLKDTAMVAKPKKGPKPKHIPQRTCIACRQEKPKRELIRVVRTLAGPLEVDPTGKKAGRGAYICANQRCWEIAFKRKALEHALETSMTPENRVVLQEYARTLPILPLAPAQPELPSEDAEVQRG